MGNDFFEGTVRIPESDTPGHLMVLGKSGTGKSNLLRNISGSVLESGSTLIMIDPHGKLAHSVVSDYNKECVYLTPFPSQSSRFLGFNILTNDGSEYDMEIISQWIKDLFSSSSELSSNTWGPRLSLIFGSLMKEYLISKKDGTIGDFARIIIDRKEINLMMQGSQAQELKNYVSSIVSDWRRWTDYVSSSMNKLLPVLSNSFTRRMVSSPVDSFDLSRIYDGREKLVVIEASKSLLPEETARILSLLMLMKVWMIALRHGTEQNRIYILIDEIQNIPAVVLERMLSEGRKFGIRLIMATQFLDQLDSNFTKSIMGNVRNFASFNVSESDARTLSSTISDRKISAELYDTLLSQNVHSCILWNMNDSGISGPLSFTSPVSESPINSERVNEIRNAFIDRNGLMQKTDPVVVEEKTIHEDMIDIFDRFLSRNNIAMERKKRISDSIPDGLFSIKGNEIILETEVSDLEKKARITEKLSQYSGRKIAFLTDRDQSAKLMSYILGASSFDRKDGIIHENGARKGKDTFYFSDFGDFFRNIYLIEMRGNRFYLFQVNKFKPLSVNDFVNSGSLSRFLEESDFGAIALSIYGTMLKTRTFGIERDRIQIPHISNDKMDVFLSGLAEDGIVTPEFLINRVRILAEQAQ
ncbi:MAG: type IV secretory system conjugative DNA transfer family protein [Thermoplasmata archaeon]